MKKLSHYAPVILRLGMTAVVAWFSVSQFINPSMWSGVVPGWATSLSGMSANTLVYINAWFEIIAAILVGVGIYTRWVALILSIHVFVIASGFGVSATGVRDFGLAVSLFALSLFGSDKCCFECKNEAISK